MKTEKRFIGSFSDLSEDWQNTAVYHNFDGDEDQAMEASYVLPLSGEDPTVHRLIDLTEAMRAGPNSDIDAYICTSNNSGYEIKFLDHETIILRRV